MVWGLGFDVSKGVGFRVCGLQDLQKCRVWAP